MFLEFTIKFVEVCMFCMEKVTDNASLDFKWLKTNGVVQNNGVQFYESFILYGVKYMLYDCVYMYNGGFGGHYIGKLTKVWECPDKTKKAEVHWFFRPQEISNWLGETKTLENEILIATGEGLGLANINPLEAIVGLCDVVCVSKDKRNPQPSDEQVKAADFVFYRTCDVQSSAISDKMGDKVGGLEVKYVFNREETEKTTPCHESIPDTKEENPNTFTSSETQQLLTKAVPYTPKYDAKREHQNKDIHSLLERNRNIKEPDKSHDRPLKKIKFDDKCDEPGAAWGFEKMTDMPSLERMVDKADKGQKNVGTVSVKKVEIKDRNTTPRGSDKLFDQPLLKCMSDDKKPTEKKRVELGVACDSKRLKEMSFKKSMSDSKLKHEDKSPADANGLKTSGTFGTIEDRKKCKVLAKEISDDLEFNKLKKTRDDGSFKVPSSKIGTNANAKDLVAISKGKSTSGIALDIRGKNTNNKNNEEAKEVHSDESRKQLSMTKSLKVSALSTNNVKKNAYREFVVGPKPNADTRWFTLPVPWEEWLTNAYNQGTAILLHNVDPDFNHRDVENIIWHAFNVNCDAKILQRTSVSSPHYAQAIIVLKKKEAAQRVLTKLDEGCLMVSDGRNSFMPLVGTPCPPIATKMYSRFYGHLAIGKARSRRRGKDEAVSTSHFSQPNNIAYDMAMEWRLLQLQFVNWWEKLHEEQRHELENLKNDLKENVHEDS